ncbi:MAG: phospholipase [Aureispira sp.]|nr:phospholipase [Aureispira sp.]
MNEHHIKFERTAHYYTLGEPNKEAKQFWLVCHGYGQLASRIIKKFNQLPNAFILAPEGFSRFYWSEKDSLVGASWMTRKDRLSEIEDYCNYISQLYNSYKEQLADDVQINILGFSQGGATVVRWMERMQPDFDNLILWGAGFPPDLEYKPLHNYLENKKLWVVQGKTDHYLTEERLAKHEQFMKSQGLDCEEVWFDGGHEIDRAILNDLLG